MKAWLRLPFSLLALLAMLATLVPRTLWACPMSGRVDVVSRVCPSATPAMSGAMPCAHMGGKCCQPVPAPSPKTDDDSGRPQLFAAPAHASFAFPLVAATPHAAPFIVPRVEAFEAPAIRSFLARFANAPPPFWTSHRPISLAGRAPPVV